MSLFNDTTTWIAVGSAIGAAVLALALSIVVAVLFARTREKKDPEVERMLQESDARFEQMLEELSRELERAREESRRSNQLSALGSTIDLDAVVERVLEAATVLPGVDAAIVVVPQEDAEPLVAVAGMSEEEAGRQPMGGPPDGREARAVTIAYRYTEEEKDDAELVRGGLVIPLAGMDQAVGTLAVFWRGRERQPPEQEIATLEELAAGAGPAIENARRFREARQLADLDALTNLHNRRFFHETLGRECARATRYDRRLSLLIFDIDDFKTINDRVGHLSGDAVLAQLAERVLSVVRSSDIACRVGGDEFAVILPESAMADAEQLYQRLQFAVASRSTGPADRIRISAGIAELRPNDDPVAFFERADEALYRAKQAGKGQSIAANDLP